MEDKPKKETIHQDRILLKGEALDRVNHWSKQVSEKVWGTKVSHTALVHWLIDSHPDELSASELNGIEAKFFDEVKYTESLLRELKVAKAKGEKTTINDLLARLRSVSPQRKGGNVEKCQKDGNPNA